MWAGGVPTTVIASFQLTFAVITPALITGAIADRMKFGSFCVFVALWVVLIYSVVAHWVWGGGWIGAKLHAIDFAGGTVVHINAGIAGLALTCLHGQAGRLAQGADEAAQRAVRPARRRPAVVRLDRLQRRLRAGC